ncbi:MAG: glutamine--fructose-6-phosphate transaminase (isomerizing) [Geminicoccaceae bacterium]
MCGIVGLLGTSEATPLLLEGLRRLAYRGYDSAGIATLSGGKIDRRLAEGRSERLAEVVEQKPLPGTVGIGHTRWATHGRPNEINAHPHLAYGVAVVHNGIIENYQELRQELTEQGHRFETETDTEVVPHLMAYHMAAGDDPATAASKVIPRLEGAYALAILCEAAPDLLICARKGTPLAIGYGDGEMYIGSDAMALAPLTDRIQYMEEGDWAVITAEGATIRDLDGNRVSREIHKTAFSGALIGKGNHRHFMEKEIHEQPAVLGDTLSSFGIGIGRVAPPPLPFSFNSISRLYALACGTASLACLIGKYWFERFAKLPVDWDIGSEFRYRHTPIDPNAGAFFVSQSGETADTMAALRLLKNGGVKTLAIVNVHESSIAREAHGTLRTLAGPEIGVASTKAFTTQLATLACLAIVAGRERGVLTLEDEQRMTHALEEVPALTAEVLEHDEHIQEIAQAIMHSRDVLYIGRGASFPIALEGALKLKEVSYIHAEGYAAGELKHGPIALIDEEVPVIVVAPPDDVFEKTASNLEEVSARGGRVVLITDARGAERYAEQAWQAIVMPEVDALVAPILYAIPVQLLAYHVAVLKGTDVDQPRNLAKSVTVE